MGYNNGLEQRKFRAEWKKLREEYRAAGMSEDAIDAMEAFDRECLNGDRRFYERTQPMVFRKAGGTDAEDTSKSYRSKFGDRLQVEARITDPDRRYSWIDELDDEELVKVVKRLSAEDIELLTLYAIFGFTVTEIAKMQHVAQPVVSKKIIRITKFIKKFRNMAMD